MHSRTQQATPKQLRFAPGMRVEIRDAEWRINRVDFSSDGGYVLACEGLSELVHGHEGLFLSNLEQVRVLEPESTQLVDDTSSNFAASLLYVESLRRQSLPSDDKLYQGHKGALDLLPFQLQPARQALKQPRQRILIADAVGLGKTLEAGMLTAELIARGRGKRILVLAVKSMLAQFQQEFWNRFTIPLTRLDSIGLQRVRNRVPSNHNPFHYFDKAIISIDTLKQDIDYRHYLEQAYWDIIIIDEAHNVADRGSHSQRARLAKLLATRSDTLIMLTATPHDGKPESFASLVNMLDPTAIANSHDYAKENFRDKGLVIRRFKKDVRDELAGQFPDREVKLCHAQASEAEEAAYTSLAGVRFHTLDGGNNLGQLFRTTLEKALFSSPEACMSTVNNRLAKIEKKITEVRDDALRTQLIEDHDSLSELRGELAAISLKDFSKYNQLLDVIRDDFGWTGKQTDDRLVIFTESLVTLRFLEEKLSDALKLKPGGLAVLGGHLSDSEQMKALEDFGRRDSKIRLLLCSDIASEGINLHHLSHRMIHFDIPWSLMVFQQRNGRIDRYGQTFQPQIRYLQTQCRHKKILGDARILEVLVEKDEQASKNIGDPSEFFGLYNADDEASVIADQMEQANDEVDIAAAFADILSSTIEGSEGPLNAFIPQTLSQNDTDTAELSAIFDNSLDYASAAIGWMREAGQPLDASIDGATLTITAPADLKQRLRWLPREACPEHHRFVLSPNTKDVSDSINRSLQDDNTPWASVQYLWPLHPVMQWLRDKSLNAFGRHTAPVVRLPGKLAANEHIVLLHGGFPNRRGHLLVHDWVGVVMNGNVVQQQLDWPELQEYIGLYPGKLANQGRAGDIAILKSLLPIAVNTATLRLKALKERFEAERSAGLKAQDSRLQALRQGHERQLQLEIEQSRQVDSLKAKRRKQRMQEIDSIFADHQSWLANTQQLECEPYLQVVAVFTGEHSADA